METFLVILSAILSSGSVISTIAIAMMNRRWAKKDKEEKDKDCIKEALQFILLDIIDRQGNAYIEQGYISRSQYERFEKCYHIYHDPDKLNGNGFASKVYNGVQGLRVVTDD